MSYFFQLNASRTLVLLLILIHCYQVFLMKLIILAVFALEKIYKIVPETTLLEICGPLDALDKHKLSQ